MTQRDDGGPAFPNLKANSSGPHNPANNGMTLRDWFAGQALAALPHIGCGADLKFSELAHDAYMLADAMLKAREVKP